MNRPKPSIIVRNTQAEDFQSIIQLSRRVYPEVIPWGTEQLASHLKVFAEGQSVAVDEASGKVVGMAASLIVMWDDYDMTCSWQDFTDHGMFTNHDAEHGRTLYAAEVMVDPAMQGRGVGKMLYQARRDLVRRLKLLRIRAGARLRGYHRYADHLSPEEYVIKVIRGEIGDPTLSFQIRQGFRVIGVVKDYLWHDPESLGCAAIIEWLNHQVARRKDYALRDQRFAIPRRATRPQPTPEPPVTP